MERAALHAVRIRISIHSTRECYVPILTAEFLILIKNRITSISDSSRSHFRCRFLLSDMSFVGKGLNCSRQIYNEITPNPSRAPP